MGQSIRRLGRPLVLFAPLVLAQVLALRPAHADLGKGVDALRSGNYELAKRTLENTSGADSGQAQVELARLATLQGRYKDAEKISQKASKSADPAVASAAKIALAEVYMHTGRYPAARDLMKKLYEAEPGDLAARHALALAYETLGDEAAADALWAKYFDEYSAGTIDLNNAQTLYFVAEAARFHGDPKDAQDNYQEAVEIDSGFHQANIDWAYLFLRKYAPSEAEQSFSDVLKLNPKHPDALAGMAELQVSASYDAARALEYVGKALEQNPRHIPALLVRASIEIDRNDWDAAKATCKDVLSINPESLDGRATLATIYWLLDDDAAYEKEKARVLKTNPHYSRFFQIVMRSAEREHRYHQEVELGKEALKVNPKDYEVMQLVGSGYLRLGLEKEGVEWLRKAYYGDQYNMRTLNLLDLFEKYIPRQYDLTKSKSFNIRYHKDERPIYERHITPMMEEAFTGMVERYGFTPKGPITIEVYPSSEHYSVRTIGLPNLGALGVCFGQVVTAMSPSVGNLNWGMVMWHELSHIFAIQLSDYRVPRWYTEGLSEYETIRARPEWRRENDSDLYAAMQDGTLPSVADLNHAFMSPSMQDVVVAYHLSSVTIEYLVAEYGFPKIVEGLKLFAKGKETPEVIQILTGRSVEQFDKEFRAHLERRLSPYRGTLHLPLKGMDDLEALKKAAEANPSDATAQAHLALSYFYAGDAKGAAPAAEAALKADAKNPIALYIAGMLALKDKQAKVAKKHFERLVRIGKDSFDVRVRLAMLAEEAGDKKAYVGHLQSAKTLDPEKAFPYEALAEFYSSEGNDAAALGELETYVMIEQMSLAPLMKLVEAYGEQAKWGKVVHFGELARNIDPGHGSLQLALGKGYQELGRHADSLYAYESALAIRPPLRRPAQAHVGRALALKSLGKVREAKAAVQDALSIEPENAEALALESSL